MPTFTTVNYSIVDMVSKKTLAYAISKSDADRKFVQLSSQNPERKLRLRTLPKGTKALLH